jgi:hypothetical protein
VLGTSNQRPNFTLSVKPTFNLIGNFPVYEGERAVPFGADVNEDGLLDLLIGNLAGGLAYYKGSTEGFTISAQTLETPNSRVLNLYPNPSNGMFTLSAAPPIAGVVSLRIMDLQGRVLWSNSVIGMSSAKIDANHLPSGMYLLETMSDSGSSVQRFIVNR